MKLLIDIGNQRIKWATTNQIGARGRSSTLHNGPEQTMDDQVIDTHVQDLRRQIGVQFDKLRAPDSVWVSSVTDETINMEITSICDTMWKLSPVFARAEANAFGIKNCYENPKLLGVDRWAAIIGGRYIAESGPLIIIDAGTAVTIDYINAQNYFLGGLIFPGLATMTDSLNLSTGLIREAMQFADVGNLQYANTNTRSAVVNGTTLSVIAGIDDAIRHYSSADDEKLKIKITGGDAECLAGLSSHKMVVERNLVLIGLMLLSGAPAK